MKFQKQTPLLSSRYLQMGSWNVRTLYETGKLALLKEEAVKYNLDGVGVYVYNLKKAAKLAL